MGPLNHGLRFILELAGTARGSLPEAEYRRSAKAHLAARRGQILDVLRGVTLDLPMR